MSLTLNSTIEELILAIGKIIVESDGKTNTAMLEIPDQDFYLEIAVKLKKEATEWNVLSQSGLSVHIKNIEKKRPIVIYKADNKGAEIKGKVVYKEKIGDLYTITIQNYGVFVVTQTNYESLKIGDEVRL